MHAGLTLRLWLNITSIYQQGNHVARIAEQGTQGAGRPILSTKPLTSIMHALSACTCICSKAEPHLLQAGALQGDTVAKATALTFLCTTDTPLH